MFWAKLSAASTLATSHPRRATPALGPAPPPTLQCAPHGLLNPKTDANSLLDRHQYARTDQMQPLHRSDPGCKQLATKRHQEFSNN
jgi:hypothetical protein